MSAQDYLEQAVDLSRKSFEAGEFPAGAVLVTKAGNVYESDPSLPQCVEPDKCTELKWFPIDAMPEDIFPFYTKIFATLKAKKLYLLDQNRPASYASSVG